jgi:hypothetical protein
MVNCHFEQPSPGLVSPTSLKNITLHLIVDGANNLLVDIQLLLYSIISLNLPWWIAKHSGAAIYKADEANKRWWNESTSVKSKPRKVDSNLFTKIFPEKRKELDLN